MIVKRYSKSNTNVYDETYKYTNAYMFLLAHKHKNLYNLKNNNSFECVYSSEYYTKSYEFALKLTQKTKNHLQLHRFYFIRFKSLNIYLNIKDFDEFCYKTQFAYIDINDDFCIVYNNKTFVLKLLDYDTSNFKVKALYIKRNQIKEFSIFDLNLHATLTTLRFFPTSSKLKDIFYPFYFLDFDYLKDMYKAYQNFLSIRFENDRD